ncbi:50S ribosomal protein L6 [Candidatus Pacearchaeota archaeon]|nr:50S ribosomal protein L6 [Candidatus Pacearchaeota archaeon]
MLTSTKMRKKLFKEIEIPEQIEIKIEDKMVVVNGPEGENKREFKLGKLEFRKEGNKIIIGYEKATKKEKKTMNTTIAHIKNMINGVQKKFEYKLKICFSHFPFTVEISGNEVKIKNFLGEKSPRLMKIPDGVDVKSDKEIVDVRSCDKELAGKVAADFERATKIRNRDRRIFQDGLYIISKAGSEI